MPSVRLSRVLLGVLAFGGLALGSPASALAGVSITLDSTDGQHYGVGALATATVTYTDVSNVPIVGATLNFTRDGVNSGSGTAATTDANGQTTISWNGTNAGNDMLTVWDDSLGSSPGVPDGSEPQDSALATFWYGAVGVSSPSYGLTGAPTDVHVFVTGEDGTPVGAGESVAWVVTGANPDSGTATTDVNGMATIVLNGTQAGSSSVGATWDNPGASSGNDPTDSDSFTWYASIQTPSSPAITGITIGPDLWCQATYNGDSSPEFYGGFPSSCGTYVRGGGTTYGPNNVQEVSQSAVSGSGTTLDPYTLTTTVSILALNVTVTTVVTYVTGEDTYRTDVTVTDNSGSPQNLTIAQYTDCYLGNSDSGYGYLDSSSGGVFCTQNPNNSPAGRLEGFIPLNTGFTRMEGHYSTVYSWMASHDTFPNTCDCTIPSPDDNGMGLSWQVSVAGNGSVTRSFLTAFSPVGSVPAGNGSGDPPPSGGGGGGGSSTPTSTTATATPTTSTAPSTNQQAPQQQQQVPPPPPEARETGNAEPTSGTILVRLPGTTTWVPIETVTSLPIGTLIDARKGVVLLTVASDLLGHVQIGEFRGGLFRFTQHLKSKTSKKLITDIKLAGGKFSSLCGTGRPAKPRSASLADSSWADMGRRRVVRYLAAKAHGSFNVVGRNAAGIERGTEWKTIDTCNSTEVRVIDGTVLVTDLVIDKTFTVKEGHTYVARDRGAKRR